MKDNISHQSDAFTMEKGIPMRSTRKIKITYWVFTLLFILPLIGSGIGFSATLPPVVEAMTHLGYPLYLIRFLGAAKLLGAVAILVGKFPTIKEWAYAGFTFNLVGASYSHLCSGDGPKALGPLVILMFAMFSYRYWNKLMRSGKTTESPGALHLIRDERECGDTP